MKKSSKSAGTPADGCKIGGQLYCINTEYAETMQLMQGNARKQHSPSVLYSTKALCTELSCALGILFDVDETEIDGIKSAHDTRDVVFWRRDTAGRVRG